jgi:tetratricopeptide (TPR) repeat protein
VLAASGRIEEALAAFENADKIARELGGVGDVEALVLAGELALTDLGDRAKASEYYKCARELKTGSPHGLVAEARALTLEGKPAEAEAKAAAAEKMDPSLALAPLVRGEIAYEQSAQEYRSEAEKKAFRKKADEFLARALRLDPNSTRACVIRGMLLIEEARLASAKAGFGLVRLGQQARAEGLLSKALKLSPKLPEIHMALADLRLGDGALHDPAVAKIRAKEAVRLTGNKDADALATLAAAQRASGDPEAAVGTMEQAVNLNPKNTGYRELLNRYKMEAKVLKP